MAPIQAPRRAGSKARIDRARRDCKSSTMHPFARRRLLLVPLLSPFALAGCGSWRRADSAPEDIAPLRYDHLTPLRLNVASLDIEGPVSPIPGDIGGRAPTPPAAALRRMAQDRLGAMGAAGRAVFTIRQAGVMPVRGGLDGIMAVRLDIFGPDGGPVGYAEARVARRNVTDDDDRAALHTMVRQLMDAMNVEFEFQVRRALRDYLAVAEPGAARPEAVDREELAPPSR